MSVNRKPNGPFELPALSSFDFNLTDGTDIPPPIPDSPIAEEAIKPTTSPAAFAPTPSSQTTDPDADPVRSTSASTPPTSLSAHGQSDFDHLAEAKSNGFHKLTMAKSHGYFPPNTPSSRNNGTPKEKESSIRKFLSRKGFSTKYSNENASAKSHDDLMNGSRPQSSISQASSRPSFAKRKSGSWFMTFGRGSNRNSVVYENKPAVYTPTLQQTPEIQKETTKPAYTKPGPPPPKLPELNQLKAKIADDDHGSLGGEEMFRNIT